jgi:hypothetical protein
MASWQACVLLNVKKVKFFFFFFLMKLSFHLVIFILYFFFYIEPPSLKAKTQKTLFLFFWLINNILIHKYYLPLVAYRTFLT